MPSVDLYVRLGSVAFIRNFLKKCQFRGLDFDYIESRGFLSRTFTIKGEMETLKEVRDLLNATKGEKPKECPPDRIDLGGGMTEAAELGDINLDIWAPPK